jgi:hypothetical protein
MILRFDMPALDLNVSSVRLHCWHSAEGDEISYGQVICEVLVEELHSLVRNLHATDVLNASAGSQRAGGSPSRIRTAHYVVRMVSSDLGYLRRISVPAGAQMKVGDTLGVMTSTVSEVLPDLVDEAWPAFRVIWDYEVENPDE